MPVTLLRAHLEPLELVDWEMLRVRTPLLTNQRVCLVCSDRLLALPMALRLRSRRTWISALMRSFRNQVVPPMLRRHLIVVDVPRR